MRIRRKFKGSKFLQKRELENYAIGGVTTDPPVKGKKPTNGVPYSDEYMQNNIAAEVPENNDNMFLQNQNPVMPPIVNSALPITPGVYRKGEVTPEGSEGTYSNEYLTNYTGGNEAVSPQEGVVPATNGSGVTVGKEVNKGVGTPEELQFGDMDEEFLDEKISDIDDFTKERKLENDVKLAGVDRALDNEINNRYNEDMAEVKKPEKPKPDSTIFNPYAGVDLGTAANIFGQNIGKGGDAGTAAASGFKLVAGLGRNITSGMGRANRNAEAMEEYNAELRRAKTGDSIALGADGGVFGDDLNYLLEGIDLPKKEDGGEVLAKELTGNYASGTNEGDENVELEVNEYLEEPGGTPKKVEGKTHEQGGEKMNLPGDTEVLSDNLTLKSDQIKGVTAEYGIKLSAKDTYAKALDKYNKKIGLTELVEEEVEVIEGIKKQKEAMAEQGADEATLNINLEFLSSKLKDITEEKAKLESMSSNAFSKLFEMQEASKPKTEREQVAFEVGGKVYAKDQILEIARNFGVSEDKAIAIVKQMSEEGVSKAEDGMKVDGDRRNDLLRQARMLGYEGDLSPENVEENIGKIQAFLVEKNPQVVIDYFKNGTAITAKGVDILKENNPEIFKELGIDLNTNSAKLTEEQRQAVQTLAMDKEVVGDDFWLDQFQDGKWEYRFPQTPLSPVAPKEIVELKAKLGTSGIASSDLGTQKLENNTKQEPKTPYEEEFVKEEDESVANKGNHLFLPDNSLLPPQGMQMPVRQELNLGRLDAERFTPDQRLQELNRAVDAAMSQIENLPSGQKEAAIMQLNSNKQAQADKIIQTTQEANNQIATKEDMFNIKQGDREAEANINLTNAYEGKVFGAMANTEDDFRRYYNTGQERQAQNYNLINSINLMNQTSENFKFGNEGVSFEEGATKDAIDMFKENNFKKAIQVSRAAVTDEEETEKKKKKVTKKRRGGRVRRKY